MSLSIRLLVIAALAFSGACQSPREGPDLADAGPRPRDWVEFPAVFTLTGTQEIDALGDLHGDIGATARVLSAAGLVTPSTPFHWAGGTRILIVTGDVIDKGTAAVSIIDLFISLEPEARAAGGRLVVTLGNHEAEFLADPTDSKTSVFQAELVSRGLDPTKVAAGQSRYGSWLLSRPVAALIDGWFFCHAGNSGGISAVEIEQRFERLFGIAGPPDAPVGFRDPFLLAPDSLLEAQTWWRLGTNATTAIDANLVGLPAQHIVFGHDPGGIDFPDDPQGNRDKGQLVMRYDGRIFLIDVGMSSAVGYSDGALLRIIRGNPDRATAVHADGTSQNLWP